MREELTLAHMDITFWKERAEQAEKRVEKLIANLEISARNYNHRAVEDPFFEGENVEEEERKHRR